jgi:hypothetical protein
LEKEYPPESSEDVEQSNLVMSLVGSEIEEVKQSSFVPKKGGLIEDKSLSISGYDRLSVIITFKT